MKRVTTRTIVAIGMFQDSAVVWSAGDLEMKINDWADGPVVFSLVFLGIYVLLSVGKRFLQ